MIEKYIYRSHLKKVQKWMLFMGIPFSVLLVFLGVFTKEYFLIGLAIFFIFYDMLLYKSYDRFTKAEFILDDEKIILKIKNIVKQEIKYNEITKIDSKSIKYTGGWMLIYGQSKKPLRLMVTIKDVGLMIKRIKAEVDAIEQSHVYQVNKLKKFFKTAYYADQSWQRSSYFMPKFFIILIAQVILAIALAIFKENELIGFIFILAMMVLLFAYIYVEYFIYAKNIRKQADEENWDILPYDEALAVTRLKKAWQIGALATAIAVVVSLLL
jgi:cbb3-type cytochrome oxidase subunit 3